MHDLPAQDIQGVIAGQLSPQDFVTAVQQDWTKNQG
jgi:hypothetical protein